MNMALHWPKETTEMQVKDPSDSIKAERRRRQNRLNQRAWSK